MQSYILKHQQAYIKNAKILLFIRCNVYHIVHALASLSHCNTHPRVGLSGKTPSNMAAVSRGSCKTVTKTNDYPFKFKAVGLNINPYSLPKNQWSVGTNTVCGWESCFLALICTHCRHRDTLKLHHNWKWFTFICQAASQMFQSHNF